MGKWICGDLHAHSDCCEDGAVPVIEIVRKARKYCHFLAISGHARQSENWGERQYAQILEARRQFPDFPLFHTAELEFPIPRHVMMITAPENREFALQSELVRRYDRLSGVTGIEKAEEELAYVAEHWRRDCFMVFNHPSAPEVAYKHLKRLAAVRDVFKVIACVDRRERRAPQIWKIGGAWDRLLSRGFRVYARCGSDFHQHFTEGGRDYWPGEFVQDYLYVQKTSYNDIVNAYRIGNFYCSVGKPVAQPHFSISRDFRLKLSFKVLKPLRKIDIIADQKCVMSFRKVTSDFFFEGLMPPCQYCRVRGLGELQKRPYEDGSYEPLFLLNPLFPAGALPCI